VHHKYKIVLVLLRKCYCFNTMVTEAIVLPLVSDIIIIRRFALCGVCGHMVRLGGVHLACHTSSSCTQTRCGCPLRVPPIPILGRPRGRARDTWLKPLMHSGTSIQSQWSGPVQRGHSHTAHRPGSDSRLWWWWMLYNQLQDIWYLLRLLHYLDITCFIEVYLLVRCQVLYWGNMLG